MWPAFLQLAGSLAPYLSLCGGRNSSISELVLLGAGCFCLGFLAGCVTIGLCLSHRCRLLVRQAILLLIEPEIEVRGAAERGGFGRLERYRA